MKSKLSITLSEDLVAAVDRMAGHGASRSAFVEKVLRDYVEGRTHERRQTRETLAINRRAAKLNEEMRDALAFQTGDDEA